MAIFGGIFPYPDPQPWFLEKFTIPPPLLVSPCCARGGMGGGPMISPGCSGTAPFHSSSQEGSVSGRGGGFCTAPDYKYIYWSTYSLTIAGTYFTIHEVPWYNFIFCSNFFVLGAVMQSLLDIIRFRLLVKKNFLAPSTGQKVKTNSSYFFNYVVDVKT